LACACAWSLPTLLTARAMRGLGASGIMSVNNALVRFVFPGRLLGRGFGYNALVVAAAFTLGPTVASGILSVGPWTWPFLINIPFLSRSFHSGGRKRRPSCAAEAYIDRSRPAWLGSDPPRG